jgi:hypothetical protein
MFRPRRPRLNRGERLPELPLPHRTRQSREAGSFFDQILPFCNASQERASVQCEVADVPLRVHCRR